MFRQTSTTVLAAVVALASFTLAAAREPTAVGGEKQITNSIGMKLTLIPSGEFLMGGEESVEDTIAFFTKNYGMELLADEYKDQYPQHRVRITKSFYLGTYHVTRGQFGKFVADSRYETDAEKRQKPVVLNSGEIYHDNQKYTWRKTGFEQTDEHPVVCMSRNDAIAFCKWLSRKDGKIYRLPTEAEWEYACRAGTTTRYYSGNDPETLAKVANVPDATFTAKFESYLNAIKASDGYAFTAPVGQFKPNAFGLYDMHGNACQWCADWYGEDCYSKSPTDDPKGPDKGEYGVIRGGSWGYPPIDARSANRERQILHKLSCDIGFRVAMNQ